METAEQHLQKISAEWDQAIISNDASLIAAFMTDDWVIVGADGVTTKAAFLQSVESGILTHHRMDSDEMIIKIYGDTAIVISKGTSAGTFNKMEFSLYEWSTSTFIKQNGSWICVATMLTPVKTG